MYTANHRIGQYMKQDLIILKRKLLHKAGGVSTVSTTGNYAEDHQE